MNTQPVAMESQSWLLMAPLLESPICFPEHFVRPVTTNLETTLGTVMTNAFWLEYWFGAMAEV